MDGLKVLKITPVPLKVPPAGEPVKEIDDEFDAVDGKPIISATVAHCCPILKRTSDKPVQFPPQLLAAVINI